MTEESTPSSRWKVEGKPDPHGAHYNGPDRAKLSLGYLTDDEIANEVFLHPTISNLTAAKERIRWLSRALDKANEDYKAEHHLLVDAAYMKDALAAMLGPKALAVWTMWAARGVTRQHTSWGPDAHLLTGEDRAQILLDLNDRVMRGETYPYTPKTHRKPQDLKEFLKDLETPKSGDEGKS